MQQYECPSTRSWTVSTLNSDVHISLFLVRSNNLCGIRVTTHITRMHSSRMRTGRSLTVRGGVSAPRGVSALGGIPACTEADTPPPLWTESQTRVKT